MIDALIVGLDAAGPTDSEVTNAHNAICLARRVRPRLQ